MEGFQSGGQPEVPAAAVVIGSIIGLVIGLGISAVMCWLLSSCYAAIPKEFRKMEPGMVWLLMIPCVNIVWMFFVYPRLPQSYKAYFASVNRTDVGDCGEQLAWIMCIGSVVSIPIGIIPFVNMLNCLLGPALLVVFILYLVKVLSLKSQVQQSLGGTAAA